MKDKIPEVYHINNAPKNAKYIGRGSVAGNPFKIGRDGSRDEVCDKYEAYLEANPALKREVIDYCKGADLKCFCKPKRCHGDYLLRISNEERKKDE